MVLCVMGVSRLSGFMVLCFVGFAGVVLWFIFVWFHGLWFMVLWYFWFTVLWCYVCLMALCLYGIVWFCGCLQFCVLLVLCCVMAVLWCCSGFVVVYGSATWVYCGFAVVLWFYYMVLW